jgi:hypothetical protein
MSSSPWADLLPELCGLVVDRLDAMSVLSFPAVCAPWSAACKETPRLRSGFPTMLTSALDAETDGCTVCDYEDGVFALHDVSTAKSFRAEAEGLKDRCWVGGKDDWLVTTDAACAVELLNPVTAARSRLPSFATIPGVEVNGEFDVLVEGEPYPRSLQRVALCRTPAHREGYLAVAMFAPNLLAFTRFGDESWTVLRNPAAEEARIIRYADTIVHEEKVVAVTKTGGVYAWGMDGNATEPTVLLQEPDDVSDSRQHKFNLAVSSGGRILLVHMYGEINWDKCRQLRRKIYDGQQWGNFNVIDVVLDELHDANNGTTRRRVSGIGSDRALFLGASYPFYIAVPRSTKELKGNCLYVADTATSDAAVIDLEKLGDGSFGRLVYSRESDAFQMPVWFRPTAHLAG